MLINFSVENFMGIRDKITLNMVATDDNKDEHKLTKLEDGHVLPVAGIFGCNSTGKTSLFMALWFSINLCRNDLFITDLPNFFKIPYVLNDPLSTKRATYFEFDFVTQPDNKIYHFEFSLWKNTVTQGWQIHREELRENDVVIYKRSNIYVDFNKELVLPSNLKNITEVKNDQLLIANRIMRDSPRFEPIAIWFDQFVFLSPDQIFCNSLIFSNTTEKNICDKVSRILRRLDIGISRVDLLNHSECHKFKDIDLVHRKKLVRKSSNEPYPIYIERVGERDHLCINYKGAGFLDVTKQLVTYHKRDDGKEVEFDIQQEPDYVPFLIDLILASLRMLSERIYTGGVWVIDDLDGKLNPDLSWHFLEAFLGCCTETSHKQLIFTSHHTDLIDNYLMRLDEMWIMNKKYKDSPELYSMSDFKENQDPNNQKHLAHIYKMGIMGGSNIWTTDFDPDREYD